MHFSPAAVVAATLLYTGLTLAQTFTACNPLSQTCPPDPALGKSVSVAFSSGASGDFTGSGAGISYNSNGAQLTVSGPGDSPTLVSNWYIMFGHVEAVIQSAPGVGMVSSFILQSDDLDEIDWEILGYDASHAQTNYFGKGYTGTYNRGTTVADPTSQSAFNTYTIDWTDEQIVWSINGVVLRTLTAAEAGNYYPQTPMTVRLGSWAGGASGNAQGTIAWAGGPINYADGPFTMQVQSVSVTDYSTGSQYVYQGNSGSWQSIEAVGGAVNGNLGASNGGGATPPTSTSSPPPGSDRSTSSPEHTGWPWTTSKSATPSPSPPSSSSSPAECTTCTSVNHLSTPTQAPAAANSEPAQATTMTTKAIPSPTLPTSTTFTGTANRYVSAGAAAWGLAALAFLL